MRVPKNSHSGRFKSIGEFIVANPLSEEEREPRSAARRERLASLPATEKQVALGLPPEDLKGIMGWAKGSNKAGRYTTARISGDREHLDRVAAFLGLDRLHLAVG